MSSQELSGEKGSIYSKFVLCLDHSDVSTLFSLAVDEER